MTKMRPVQVRSAKTIIWDTRVILGTPGHCPAFPGSGYGPVFLMYKYGKWLFATLEQPEH
jgi:hypothetical protein